MPKKKKARKKRLKKTKGYFVQSLAPYPTDVFVCVGMSFDEIIKTHTKIHAPKYIIKWLQEAREGLEADMKTSRGFVCSHNSSASILWLREWGHDWDLLGVFIHELHHLVHHTVDQHRGMEKEAEAQAYMYTHLFETIRRKLNRIMRTFG